MMETMLRGATWLSPGLPLEMFDTITGAVAAALHTDFELVSYTGASGPTLDDNPFARGDVDLGFMCAPSYRRLAAQTPRTIELVGAAPVFADPRNGGRPTYFAELVARRELGASSLLDLKDRRIGYNDEQSMSGLTALLDRMTDLHLDTSFATLVRTGGHHTSLEQLTLGDIDAASIDSNTLLGGGPLPEGLVVIETWGPLPVQPVVIRATVAEETREVITTTLLSLHEDSGMSSRLRRWNIERFAPVRESDYT